jgi:hypothetical protein
MHYDLELICHRCREIGLSARIDTQRVEVDLGEGAILCFQNAEREEDCLVGFLDTPWHVHDKFVFADRGSYVELDYLDVLAGLKAGQVLVCEQKIDGQTSDRWLIHSQHNDEFEFLEERERITIRRVTTTLP